VPVDDAFKDPEHPFRIAVVCAMWLTGFDVECLATLYIDKPMKAHTLMQAIARANRVYPGKSCGVIVDYNGMLKSLREALAHYALGDDDDGSGGELVAPVEELVPALLDAIEAAENHLKGLGFDPGRLSGATGFDRIEALRDAKDAVLSSDDARRRFEIMVRQVFIRFKALLMEPSVFQYAERHDNLEAIYKKLQEAREGANVTGILKELHKIVNEAIRTQQPGEDHAGGLTVDLSSIDFKKLRAAEEGLTEDELALFDLLFKKKISKADREKLKQASRGLLASLQDLLKPMPRWTKNSQTQAEVEVFVMNNLFSALPNPPFTSDETEEISRKVYDFIWQRSESGHVFRAKAAP